MGTRRDAETRRGVFFFVRESRSRALGRSRARAQMFVSPRLADVLGAGVAPPGITIVPPVPLPELAGADDPGALFCAPGTFCCSRQS